MTQLDSLFDPTLFQQMLDARYIKCQQHPAQDLRIYNYTQLTQFDRVWNPVTLACRGLVVGGSQQVLARPFAKFFNVTDYPEDALPTGEVHVTEKVDGSLGILYPSDGGFAIATRGSFVSEQARHGTALWLDRYADVFTPNAAWTYLFEIVYPGNRVVVDYGAFDDLVLLGAVETGTGRSVRFEDATNGWPGPVAGVHPARSLSDALGLPARSNTEGVVVHFCDADLRVKVKHDEYVRLHRIVTDVSERRVWEALASGLDLEPWLEAVPDECFAFVTATRDRLECEHARGLAAIEEVFESIIDALPPGWSRRDFATAVASLEQFPLARALFLRLDGRDCSDVVWRSLRPETHQPVWGRGEDVN